jgi:hypothetical protein
MKTIPVCFNATENGTSSAYDVRKSAYLNVFAGAFGHTYGCHDIWQMYAPHRTPINGPHYPWYVAMDLPGASQLKYLRRLIESRPFFDRVPDQSLINNALGSNDHIQATRGIDYILVYSSQGKKFTVNTSKSQEKKLLRTGTIHAMARLKRLESLKKSHNRSLFLPSTSYGQIGFWSLTMRPKFYRSRLEP